MLKCGETLTLAGTPILLELIAWTAGAEIAADVVVAQVLAPGRGVLLNRVELQGTFVQVWKRFQKEGFNFTKARVGGGRGRDLWRRWSQRGHSSEA